VNDTPRKLIEIGTVPSGTELFVTEGEIDPIAIMLRQAGETLDRERAEAERKRLSAIADIERAQRTKRARSLRRLMRAFRAFAART
jgi:hypothetical protein